MLFSEARDVHATLASLHALATHPATPKHEAEAARNAAARLRAIHKIPEPKVTPPRPAAASSAYTTPADRDPGRYPAYKADIDHMAAKHRDHLKTFDASMGIHSQRYEDDIEHLSLKHSVPRSRVKDHIWNAHMKWHEGEVTRKREEEMANAKPKADPGVAASRALHGDVASTVRKHKEYLDFSARGKTPQTGDGYERKKSAFHTHVMKMGVKHGIHPSAYRAHVDKLHRMQNGHLYEETAARTMLRVLRG